MELKKGETIMIDAALHLPVSFLHEAFSDRSGVPLALFELYYRGKRLEGEAALASLGVGKGSTIEVKMRGRGGTSDQKGKQLQNPDERPSSSGAKPPSPSKFDVERKLREKAKASEEEEAKAAAEVKAAAVAEEVAATAIQAASKSSSLEEAIQAAKPKVEAELEVQVEAEHHVESDLLTKMEEGTMQTKDSKGVDEPLAAPQSDLEEAKEATAEAVAKVMVEAAGAEVQCMRSTVVSNAWSLARSAWKQLRTPEDEQEEDEQKEASKARKNEQLGPAIESEAEAEANHPLGDLDAIDDVVNATSSIVVVNATSSIVVRPNPQGMNERDLLNPSNTREVGACAEPLPAAAVDLQDKSAQETTLAAALITVPVQTVSSGVGAPSQARAGYTHTSHPARPCAGSPCSPHAPNGSSEHSTARSSRLAGAST